MECFYGNSESLKAIKYFRKNSFLDNWQASEHASGYEYVSENEYRIIRATARKLRNTEHNSILIKFIWSEAVVQWFSVKKVFLKISQNSQENTCARV